MRRSMRITASILAAAMMLPLAGTGAAIGGRQVNAAGVAVNSTNFPDDNFRRVIATTYDRDGDGYLSDYEISTTMNIVCEGEGIKSIKGIEFFTDIQGLWCRRNEISSMDLSHNKDLHGVWCSENPLTSLDFTPNPEIEWVYCFDCNLTYLNVSNNPNLSYLECNTNPLKTLDVSHNPLLEHLTCGTCELKALDVSHNPRLTHLDAFQNEIKTLDVSQNPRMKRLDIWWNRGLKSIDVSHNPELQYYNCAYNNATTIDVSHNPELQKLICSYNEISVLDLSNNPKLAWLDCACNSLSRLDISHNPQIYFLQAFTNPFTTLDISNNSRLIKTYNAGVCKAETGVGIAHSWTIDYGIAPEVGVELMHFLCFDDKVTLNATPNPAAEMPDSYIDPDYTPSDNSGLVTREAAIQVLYEMAGKPSVAGLTSRFSDVEQGAWYEDALKWGEANNIAFGYPNVCSDTFGVGVTVTREDLALMMHRYGFYMGYNIGFDYGRTDWFKDYLDIDYYAWGAVTWAIQWEIMYPDGNDSMPPEERNVSAHGTATRNEFTGMLTRLNERYEPGKPVPAIPDHKPFKPINLDDIPDEPGVSGFVERLYAVALGRPSDPSGKADWVNRVTIQGYTGADLAEGFLYSDEFLGKGLSDSEFLDVLYATFFSRKADQGGKTNWLNAMAAGMTKKQVIRGFIDSTEWANLCLTYGIISGGNGVPNITIEPSDEVRAFVTRLYSTCLGREGDPWGMNDWSSRLSNMRISGSVCAHGFFFSDEFINRNLDDAEYVTRLYRTFMNREPDAAGFADWTGQLAAGASRQHVFDGFANSIEWAQICAGYGIIK